MCIVAKGTWVEVERVVIRGGERAPGFMKDPLRPPQVVRVSGFLLEDAELGQHVRIRTIIGNEHSGKLRIENPGYGHSFGNTFPELMRVGAGGAA
jgi:2-amino-4-ketopentanoate thiolase alpha subunit